MATWSSLELCKRSDIENEVGSLDAIVQLPEPEKSSAIRKAIDTTKGLIRDKLVTCLPQVYASSVGPLTAVSYHNWLITQGFSYTDLDDILDKLNNPTELASAAVAGCVYYLCNRTILQFKISMNQAPELLGDQRDHWKKEFECRLDSAVKRLKFDLNSDGEIDDFERQRTHNTFFRV